MAIPTDNETQPSELKIVNPEQAGLRVIDQGYKTVVGSENQGAEIPEELKAEVAFYLRLLRKYVSGVLATDTFVNHRDIGDGSLSRSDWEVKQPSNVQDWLDTNRLRINRLADVYTPLIMLVDVLDQLPQDDRIGQLKLSLAQAAKRIMENKNQVKEFFVPAQEHAQRIGISIEELEARGFKVNEQGMVALQADDESTGYDTLSKEEKLKLVEEVTQACVETLKMFGYQVSKR